MTRNIFVSSSAHPVDRFVPNHLRDSGVKHKLSKLKRRIVEKFRKYSHKKALSKARKDIITFLNMHWINKEDLIPCGDRTIFLECNERLSVDRMIPISCFYATRDVDAIFILVSGQFDANCVGCVAFETGYIFALEEEIGSHINEIIRQDRNEALRGSPPTETQQYSSDTKSETINFSQYDSMVDYKVEWKIEIHTFDSGVQVETLKEYPENRLKWYWIDAKLKNVVELPILECDCVDSPRDTLYSFHMEDVRNAYFKEIRIRQRKIIIKKTPLLLREGVVGMESATETTPFSKNMIQDSNVQSWKRSSPDQLKESLLTRNPFIQHGQPSPKSPLFTPGSEVALAPYAYCFAALAEEYVYMLARMFMKESYKHLRFSLFLLRKHDNIPMWVEIDSTISKILPYNTKNFEVAIASHPFSKRLFLCHMTKSRDQIKIHSFSLEKQKWMHIRTIQVGRTFQKEKLDLYVYKNVIVARFEERGVIRAILFKSELGSEYTTEHLLNNKQYLDTIVVTAD